MIDRGERRQLQIDENMMKRMMSIGLMLAMMSVFCVALNRVPHADELTSTEVTDSSGISFQPFDAAFRSG